MIAKQAHKPYSRLNSIIARKVIRIDLKLKTCALIERLAGPVIGLYCFYFFPFTYYEFYLFVGNCPQHSYYSWVLFKIFIDTIT